MKKMMIYTALLLFFISVMGCEMSSESEIQEISTSELAQLLKGDNQDYYFVDVREEDEYNETHIKEMVNVPLSTLDTEYSKIPEDKTVVIICRSGNRSLQAANLLKENGYKDLINVKGGMLKWDGEVTG
ncbi:rhodanese-like domain-containing protein [Evansella tamaricis]|uniref:Rhodanese-like domain-containing protein n=1 Tax=Evansella tamaricis TaxID=2069301 RepID=A0ABS6JKK1_9BACI|nr:rhodanese-like domain-containing protein [Evansella tamaricis]MBU9714192.1 rhodanese-like domain-containing protein [Evansella tamaricis]